MMGDTTTMKLKSAGRSMAGLLNTEEQGKSNPEIFEHTRKELQGIEIKDIRTVEDLDALYQGLKSLQNTIVILHSLDLLNGVSDLKPAAILAAPCSESRLNRQIARLKKENESTPQKTKRTQSKTIIIYTHDGFEVIRTKEILHITAERAYCQIFLTEGRKLTVSKPLREIEDQLSSCFFRTHHSHLVNLCKVVAYKKDAGGELVLKDGSRVPVARSRKEEVEGRLSNRI